uniref:Putative defensin n=1 Tax=Panstrongylus lignarius TaxID=156445 RepID=A0A224XRA1_9HEMI
MKCTLCLVTLFLVAAFAYSYPAAELAQQQFDDHIWDEPADGEISRVHAPRVKRDYICGVIEPGSFTLNHAGCNSHCRVRGHRGGHCGGTTCQCT